MLGSQERGGRLARHARQVAQRLLLPAGAAPRRPEDCRRRRARAPPRRPARARCTPPQTCARDGARERSVGRRRAGSAHCACDARSPFVPQPTRTGSGTTTPAGRSRRRRCFSPCARPGRWREGGGAVRGARSCARGADPTHSSGTSPDASRHDPHACGSLAGRLKHQLLRRGRGRWASACQREGIRAVTCSAAASSVN